MNHMENETFWNFYDHIAIVFWNYGILSFYQTLYANLKVLVRIIYENFPFHCTMGIWRESRRNSQ